MTTLRYKPCGLVHTNKIDGKTPNYEQIYYENVLMTTHAISKSLSWTYRFCLHANIWRVVAIDLQKQEIVTWLVQTILYVLN